MGLLREQADDEIAQPDVGVRALAERRPLGIAAVDVAVGTFVFIKIVWTGPDRYRVRVATRAAISDIRANGETDIEVPTDQHRHGAQWQWW